MEFKPKNSYSYKEIIECSQGNMFPNGLPRLPMPPMLMFHRFTDVSAEGGRYGKGYMVAELDIDPSNWFFECHFKDDKVMPGCLGVDALWQMLGFYLGWRGHTGRGRALGCGEIKSTDQVLPDAGTITLRIDIKRIVSRKLILGIADGILICKGQTIYHCDGIRSGLFN